MTTPVTTAAELYDLLQRDWGLGNYDDVAVPVPEFWKARMSEVSKLKAMLKRRRCTPQEVALASAYAKSQRKTISAAWQVFELVPEAIRASLQEEKVSKRSLLTAAAVEASNAGQVDWAQRLFAANIAAADELIAAWNAHKETAR